MDLKKRSQIGAAAAVCAVFVVLSLVGMYKDKLIFDNPPYPTLLNTSFEDHGVVQIDITATNPFDTSQLTVDPTKAEVGARTLMAPAFATGSLHSDADAKSDVLVIGLGGGQINNYLHYKFPKMNLTAAELEASMVEMARKYFGLKEDETQRVFVIDGIDYVQKAVKQGSKFDAIYLDACPTSQAKEIEVMCPVPIFLEDKNIALIRNALKETGSLVIKVLLFSDDVDEKAEKLADIYRKHFANCAVLEMVTLVNRVIVCSREGIPKERYEKKTLSNSVTKFYTSAGLKDEECCSYAVDECCSAA